jgi:undecaprenyl pyrophosphate phosphatase UppP
MFDYRGLQDVLFVALYCGVAFLAVLLRMLQDHRRPLWPWLVVMLPVVMFAIVGMDGRSWYYGYELPHYYQLAVCAVFVVYYIFALWQYGRWLRDNYADLEHKEVWQSLTFVVVLFVIYAVYTSNMGEMAREYLSQVISIVIIAFLLWRVETLEELPSEEDMDNGSLRSK